MFTKNTILPIYLRKNSLLRELSLLSPYSCHNLDSIFPIISNSFYKYPSDFLPLDPRLRKTICHFPRSDTKVLGFMVCKARGCSPLQVKLNHVIPHRAKRRRRTVAPTFTTLSTALVSIILTSKIVTVLGLSCFGYIIHSTTKCILPHQGQSYCIQPA